MVLQIKCNVPHKLGALFKGPQRPNILNKYNKFKELTFNKEGFHIPAHKHQEATYL